VTRSKDEQRMVDDLVMARKELTTTVNTLMSITDRLVALVLELIKAVR